MLRFTSQIRRISSAIRLHPEIKHALDSNLPIVALESTIITHGLPYPANIEMAQSVESIIRSNGCIPATMGYIKGQAVIGCNEQDLEQMGDPNTPKMKISRRDICTAIGRKITGGTTIATTMDLCNRVGIDVFATGGLGGVSRPFELMDVSADLEELAKTAVAVVCSGPKSILDVGRTLEYLETKGVMVSTLIDDHMFTDLIRSGRVKSKMEALDLIKNGETLNVNVPGFYIRDSGIPSPYVFEDAQTAARLIYASKYQMNLPAGQVFCIPAPKEVELDANVITKVIDESLAEAERIGICGKELTPFLLGRINKVTNGESVKCNVEFVKNNARMACEIAKSLCDIKNGVDDLSQPVLLKAEPIKKEKSLGNVNTVVIGSVAVDVICKTVSHSPYLEDSNPGNVNESIGGVGFNVARAAQAGSKEPILFISTVNKNDSGGDFIAKKMEELGMANSGLINREDSNTAKYVSIHKGDGELIIACADMAIIEKLKIEDILPLLEKYQPRELVFDANISVELMNDLIAVGSERGIIFVFEPTSVVKCTKISQVKNLPVYPNTPISLVTPTINELTGMVQSLNEFGKFDDIEGWFNVLDSIGATSLRDKLDTLSNRVPLVRKYLQNGIFQMAVQLLPFMPTIVLKDGANGVTIIQISSEIAQTNQKASVGSEWSITSGANAGRHGLGISIEHFISGEVNADAILSVTGAGDALLGSLLSQCGGVLPAFGSKERAVVISNAQAAAVEALCSR